VAPEVKRDARRVLFIALSCALVVLLSAVALVWRERLRAAQRVRLFEAMAQQEKLALLGTLTASLGHEIGNILAIVTLAVDLAISRSDDAVVGRALGRAEGALHRLEGLSRDLLGTARASEGEARRVVLCDLIEESARLLTPRLKHGPKLELDLDPRVAVRGKRALLGQLVLNLIINATDAVDPKTGQVWVSLSRRGDEVVLEVEDDGPGISPTVIGTLFDPFVTTKAEGNGTGLGLWLSRQVAEASGGQLVAGHSPRGGARFTLRLPVIRTGTERLGKSDPVAALRPAGSAASS